MTEKKTVPTGELAIKTQCMPADKNPAGDIFGGWLLAEMDIAGSVVSKRIAGNRTVTVAVDSMTFVEPVFVGDVLHCYVDVRKIGNTSITLQIEAWVNRQFDNKLILVTEGEFVYVSVNAERKPIKIKQKQN